MAWQPPSRPQMSVANRREDPRQRANKPAVLHYAGTRVPVFIKDISCSGVRLQVPTGRMNVPDAKDVKLDIPGLATLPVTMRWGTASAIGVAFDVPNHRRATLEHQITYMMKKAAR